MPQPILCLDEEVRHFAERFRPLYSKPHYQYFVTVLLGLLREVGQAPSLSGLSRFLAEAPWSQEAIVASWQKHFRTKMQPLVKAGRDRQRKLEPKRRGRPKQPLEQNDALACGYQLVHPRSWHRLTPSSLHMFTDSIDE